jgi:hypothetical protein
MKQIALTTLLSFLICFESCDSKLNSTSFSVKLGEAKIHKKSGLKITVSSANVAAAMSIFKWLVSKDEAEKKASDAYEFGKKLGLDEILVATAIFPNGESKSFNIGETTESFCFFGNGNNFLVNTLRANKSFGGKIKVYFEIVESDCVLESKNKQAKPLFENSAKSDNYTNSETLLNSGDTFNDELTGLHFHIKTVDYENQKVVADFRTPDMTTKIESKEFNSAEPFEFIYDSKTFLFTIISIRPGLYCDVQLKEK